MKKIMILGAGRGQVQLIKTAKELGYYTIVASIEGNYPGFDIADESVMLIFQIRKLYLNKRRN